MHRRSCWNSQKSEKIHDLVKFVVPCAVFEVEFPILPNKSVHMGSYIGVLYNPLHAEASQRGTRFNSDVDKGPSMEVSNATNLISLIHTCRVSEQKEFEVCQNIFDGGVLRYFNGKYAQSLSFGGMIGFVLSGKNATIKNNIFTKLNEKFNISPEGDLISITDNSIDGNNFTFNSKHKRLQQEFTIHHLLFDFTN